MITYAKIGAAILAVLLLFGLGYHFGGLASKTKLEASQEAQSQAVAKAVIAQQAASQAEQTRLNKVIADYEATPINPVVTGIAGRLYKYEIRDCPVSHANANSPGTSNPSGVPGSDSTFERLSQDAFDAADRDSRKLTAIQKAWP